MATTQLGLPLHLDDPSQSCRVIVFELRARETFGL
jgi:hypothetical protein